MEERLGAGVLQNDGGCMLVRGSRHRDLSWARVGRRGEGAVDDEVGVVELPWLDRAWCGQGGCVGPRRGEGQRHGVAVVSVPCRGRQHGGGRCWAVGKGLKVLRA